MLKRSANADWWKQIDLVWANIYRKFAIILVLTLLRFLRGAKHKKWSRFHLCLISSNDCRALGHGKFLSPHSTIAVYPSPSLCLLIPVLSLNANFITLRWPSVVLGLFPTHQQLSEIQGWHMNEQTLEKRGFLEKKYLWQCQKKTALLYSSVLYHSIKEVLGTTVTLPFFPNHLQDLQFQQSTQIKEASKAPCCSLSCCKNFVHSCLHRAASSLCLATASLCSTATAVGNVSDSLCHCWVELGRQLSSENLQAEKKPQTNKKQYNWEGTGMVLVVQGWPLSGILPEAGRDGAELRRVQ